MALSQAILATLLDRPCSGYDLRKRFEGSVGFFWQASFQQIYCELSKLQAQGLVQGEAVAQQGRPDKTVFAVTTAGEAFLQTWIQQACDMAPVRDDLMVKMFAGFLVPQERILTELQAHQVQHRERLAIYYQIEQAAYAHPQALSEKDLFRYLTLRAGIQYETGWLAWCEEAMTRLKER
jgi:DNA-binding PadR family transcriptional regulator